MARQRKSLDNQIHALEEQINKLQDKLDVLMQQKEELENKKREEELGELYNFMKANELSIEDLYGLIGQNEGQEDLQTA
ncbi:hypothetical protein DWX43_01905 [Clostridium sp. AF19-22AC]|jgi:predicted  nucleic acid-binding Zn-ribbon protein|uniref:Uncharacterized protein n=1 Tax=Faecalicatena orotica TaxID=1544 RepID=A0A2Y9BE25_9FIRM|nr:MULTISPECIES: hypothetical protein [Clostridia]PWJ29024.1 hypothetical protein A8806_107173 [Faecalicatena orotica]RHR33186.1 hypothetical protein DWX43_01905 [Clostridium sp. AF19-22AC]SSA56193.1 hypothetical protein SAMN05216536_107173 [Faecalicatena orotica]